MWFQSILSGSGIAHHLAEAAEATTMAIQQREIQKATPKRISEALLSMGDLFSNARIEYGIYDIHDRVDSHIADSYQKNAALD